jgi:hypothetical protein
VDVSGAFMGSPFSFPGGMFFQYHLCHCLCRHLRGWVVPSLLRRGWSSPGSQRWAPSWDGHCLLRASLYASTVPTLDMYSRIHKEPMRLLLIC